MAVSLSDFTKTFQYVTTKSGPVVPARTTTVDMMKGTLPPVDDQTKKDFDHRTYKNRNLEMKKNYLTLKDIGIKLMTEATSSTSSIPMRLNLNGMDLDQTSLNGTFACDGEMVTVNMKYPNKNDQISVDLTLDDGNSMLYQVSPESDQFRGNFAQSIRNTARNLILKDKNPSDMDEMLYGTGAIKMPGNNFNDTLGIANSDPNNFVAYESVDWKLQKLLDVCNEAVAMFEDEQNDGKADFTADDFSAPAGDDQGDDFGTGADAGMGAGDGTEAPANAGQVNGVTDGNGKGNTEMDFRQFCMEGCPEEQCDPLSQAAVDNLAHIVADRGAKLTEENGTKLTSKEMEDGFGGTKNMNLDELLDQFLAFDEFQALDTTLPIEGLKQFAKAMEDGTIDVTKLSIDLGKWFPEQYNTDGTAIHNVAKEVAAMTFPSDDKTGVGQGLGMNSTMDFNSYDGFNDTAGMMDQANAMVGNGNTDPGIDMSEGGSSSEEGGKDKTDIAIDSLDNLF